MKNIKQNYTNHDLMFRMHNTINNLVNQGCNNLRTFIDVDSIVGLKPLEISLEIKSLRSLKNITNIEGEVWKNKSFELSLNYILNNLL